MFKKTLIRVSAVVVLVLLVLMMRMLNGRKAAQTVVTHHQEQVILNNTLTGMSGSGYVTIAENDALRLDLCFEDGNITVTNKQNGYEWRSAPTEEEMLPEKSNELWKGNLRSPIFFTYVNDYTATDVKYGNVFNQNITLSVFALPDGGTRVYFEFLSTGITMGYDIKLKADHIEVSLPSYLISDPGEFFISNGVGQKILDKSKTFILNEINLFPNFGATRSDMGNAGYLLVPDGTGALMRFDSDKYINSQFLGHVYGTDLALYNNYDNTLQTEFNRPTVNFPIFGIVRDGNSLLGIVDKGETQTDIIGSKANVQTGFNTTSCRFVYRMKYKILTNTATGDGYFSFTRFPVNDERQILYYLGSGEAADYVGMAQTYRGYLIEKYGLKRIDSAADPASLQLNILCGTVKNELLGYSIITMTSFEQAKEMLRDLKQAGITYADVVLRGWAKRGDQVLYPDRFPIETAFGGEQGLTSLAETAKSLGYKLFLHDDSIRLRTSRGVSIRNDTIYNIQDNALFGGTYANPAAIARNFEKAYVNYERLKISGIEDGSLGWFLTSDFSQSAPMSREDVKNAHVTAVRNIVERFGEIRLETTKAYILGDHMTLTYVSDSSYLTILDDSVPFYTIAMHGLVDYLCGDYNSFFDPPVELLKAVEYGGNISFTITQQPTEMLKEAVRSHYYSTEYALWRDDIIQYYNSLRQYLELTRGQYITGHEKITPNVVRVSYENNVQVIINYSQQLYTYQNNQILPQNFIVLEGEK